MNGSSDAKAHAKAHNLKALLHFWSAGVHPALLKKLVKFTNLISPTKKTKCLFKKPSSETKAE
jgi:hypothetical protein